MFTAARETPIVGQFGPQEKVHEKYDNGEEKSKKGKE
jgi:hypothetical protein